MNLVKTVSIFISGVFSRRMVDAFMPVSPLFQAVVNVILIRVDHASCGNGLRDDGLDGLLLNIGEHFDENFAIALE